MQTKKQIQALLASVGIEPNKRRGQNFMIDQNLIQLLVNSAGIRHNDIALEIGCGTGTLTEELVKYAGWVIVSEIEEELAKITQSRLKKHSNFDIIVSDILESKNTIDNKIINAISQAKNRYDGRILLIANLPYSVACPAMINLITGPEVIADAMYVTVQKEVAQRMTATPNSDHYGPATILMAITGDTKLIRTLSPSVFWPQPQVDSAMISFIHNKKKADRIHNMKILTEVISLFMGHRRKMLRACTKLIQKENLAKIHNWQTILSNCLIDPHLRAEQLTPENFLSIANQCAEFLDHS